MSRVSLVLVALIAAACSTGNAAFDETPVLAVARHLLQDEALSEAKSIPVCLGGDLNFSPTADTFAALRALDGRVTACRPPDTTPNTVFLRIRTVTKGEHGYVVGAGLYCPVPRPDGRDCTDHGDFVVRNVAGEWRVTGGLPLTVPE